MTNRAFQFQKPADREALCEAVARHFRLRPAQVCLYEDARELTGPFEDRPAGRLWRAYDESPVRVFLSPFDPAQPTKLGWFAVETERPEDNGFEDGPLAAAVAAALGQTIIFRDPAPDPRDSPYVEAAQIGVDPHGLRTELWIVEYGTSDRGDVTEVMRRDAL